MPTYSAVAKPALGRPKVIKTGLTLDQAKRMEATGDADFYEPDGLRSTLDAGFLHGWQYVLLGPGAKFPQPGIAWQITKDERVVWLHLARRGGGVGLVTGLSNVAVLDFDNDAARREMFEALGPLTPWATSPSGGMHCYVVLEPNLPAKLRWNGEIVGEVQRGERQQVVMPPTPYPGNPKRGVPAGGEYTWLVDPRGPVPTLPDAWRRHLLSGGVEDQGSRAGEAIPRYIKLNDKRGGEWLNHWEGPDAAELQRRALTFPKSKRRRHGVKFQCPQCRADGHDKSHDNAFVANDGRFGCAYAPGDSTHRRAIAVALDLIARDPDFVELRNRLTITPTQRPIVPLKGF